MQNSEADELLVRLNDHSFVLYQLFVFYGTLVVQLFSVVVSSSVTDCMYRSSLK